MRLTHACKRLLMVAVCAALGVAVAPTVRAADEVDQNDPALRRAAKGGKMTPEQLVKIRIAELEGGAITEMLKTPDAVTIVGPPLSEREKTVQVFNRLSFGPRPGDIDEVSKSGWEKWVKAQLDPDKIDDSKLDALVQKRYATILTKSMEQLSNDFTDRDEKRKKMEIYRRDLREMVLVRSVMSNRQFKEVMAEFWRNHFCVDTPDNDETARSYTATDYEEKVIRKHVMGDFKMMLFDSARHPCMLEYLDNFKSRGNGQWNENYAREVMELHTLGADRFYNEYDVLELTKVLTGWTYNDKFQFEFRSNWHQQGPKTVLGTQIKPGYEGGEYALYGLATHRGTADFIAFKLCRYLVNDNPPSSLVSKVSSTFKSSGGNLSKTYAAIINSPEFLQRANYRAKFKTPFEFTVSALRMTGAQVDDATDTLKILTKMGQPIYNSKDPTGYYDQAEAWRDAGVLTSRWDYTWKLLTGRIKGVTVSSDFIKSFAGLKDQALIDKLTDTLIGSDIGSRTLDILRKTQADGKLEDMISILMGSPSFQQQ
ncbi:MAG: DUF1800 domain-containing protein [Phycisphaerae bacterium]|nr:DUF1800 domain-containing protein [Tepidisphaeraceae bacterium]